jgi:hypothetical protein
MERIFYFVLLILCFALCPFLNRHPNNENVARIVKFWLDDLLPLTPIFVVPYLLFLPFLFGTIVYFLFFTGGFRVATVSLAFCQLAACLCFIFYQTKIIRPEILSSDVFSETVRLIFANDEPFNCFPSTHVSLSMICGWLWMRRFPQIRSAMILFVVLICLSTLFTKQHIYRTF